MARRPRYALPLWALPVVLTAGCTPESIFDREPSAEEDDAGDADEAGTFEADRPRFLEPPGGTMTIEADHRETISLRVQAVDPGSTVLLIDGQTIGTLPEGQREGRFGEGRLHLFFSGGLTEGVHSLTLFNPGIPSGELSPPVAIEVRPSAERVPQLELSDTVVAEAVELRQDGAGSTEVLSWVDASGTLTWVAGDQVSAWSTEESTSFSPAGYQVRDGGWARASVFPHPRGWRVAWLEGRSAQTLRWAELSSASGEAQVEDEGSLNAGELAFLGGESRSLNSAQLGPGFLLTSFEAARDSENEAPGDRGLLYQRWPETGGPGLPQRLNHYPNANLSEPHPLVELRPNLPSPLEFSVSVDDTWVRRISSEPSLGLINFPEGTLRFTDPLPADTEDFATVAGALGSRTTLVVAGADSRVNFEAVFAERGESQDLVGAVLPDQAPSGPIATSCWDGRSVFALPYADAGVRIVVSDGARGRAYESTITCDQIALARPTLAPDEAHSPTLGVACLYQGELRFGELSVAP